MKFKLQSFNTPMNVDRIANIHYFEFTNHYSTKNDSHNFCELVYVDRGTLSVHAENFSGNLSVNQLIIHRPNEIHSLTTSETVAPNVIIIGFECSCNELVPFSKKPVTLSPAQGKLLAQIMQEAMNYFEPPYDIPNTAFMKKRTDFPFGADQMIKICLESFLISLVRDLKQSNHALKSELVSTGSSIGSVHQYLTENFSSKISLDNLCFLFGTNKTTLCKLFKQEYGTTILNYVTSLKIKEAKSLLRENKLSITEIATSLGFDSIHYFCRQFKKATGQSPTEYSKTVKAKLNM